MHKDCHSFVVVVLVGFDPGTVAIAPIRPIVVAAAVVVVFASNEHRTTNRKNRDVPKGCWGKGSQPYFDQQEQEQQQQQQHDDY